MKNPTKEIFTTLLSAVINCINALLILGFAYRFYGALWAFMTCAIMLCGYALFSVGAISRFDGFARRFLRSRIWFCLVLYLCFLFELNATIIALSAVFGFICVVVGLGGCKASEICARASQLYASAVAGVGIGAGVVGVGIRWLWDGSAASIAPLALGSVALSIIHALISRRSAAGADNLAGATNEISLDAANSAQSTQAAQAGSQTTTNEISLDGAGNSTQTSAINSTRAAIKAIFSFSDIRFVSMLCIGGFWAICALYLGIFALESNLSNLSLLYVQLAGLGIGLVAGFLLSKTLSRGYIELGFVPIGALGIVVVSCFMAYLGADFGAVDFGEVFWRWILFAVLGSCGGVMIAPLDSLIIYHSTTNEISLDDANNSAQAGSQTAPTSANNPQTTPTNEIHTTTAQTTPTNEILALLCRRFVCALCALAGLVLAWVFGSFFVAILLGVGLLFLVVRFMPHTLVRALLSCAFLQRYRLLADGFWHLPSSGGALLLGNHASFVDWAIVQMASVRRVYFVMERGYYSRWYLRAFLDICGVIVVPSLESQSALERVRGLLDRGEIVCVFPEGVLSCHGHLNEFKKHYEALHARTIVPFYIQGLWGSYFSRSDERFAARNKALGTRIIAIAFGARMDDAPADAVKARVFELSFCAWALVCASMGSIHGAFISTAKRSLSSSAIWDEVAGEMSFRKLLGLSIALGALIRKTTAKDAISSAGKNGAISSADKNSKNTAGSTAKSTTNAIGIMLPASMASALCNLAVLFAGKTTVNLNFTAGAASIKAAINSAAIKHIYTSKKFMQTLADRGISIDFDGASVYYLEDIIAEFKTRKFRLLGLFVGITILPCFVLKALYARRSSDIAAILFSSGSEGSPKGVMLGHKNILSNIAQISEVLCATDNDCVLSSLPPFHAFGLTVTTFMPLIIGLKSAAYPDPTNAAGIAKVIAKNNVSIMFGTSTFLGIYARSPKVDALMLDSVRVVVAGAEKLKPEIRNAFEMKFKKTICEGYGATETTPVAAVNLPNKYDAHTDSIHRASKIGSVGMPLPGTAVRIVDPDSYECLDAGRDGLILIGGHQIMAGYLNDEAKTASVVREMDGIRWYSTGDKGHLDSDGFLYIVDRYSRFAKIGGEMISLGMVEEQIAKALESASARGFGAGAGAGGGNVSGGAAGAGGGGAGGSAGSVSGAGGDGACGASGGASGGATNEISLDGADSGASANSAAGAGGAGESITDIKYSAVAVDDSKKGEMIVLLLECSDSVYDACISAIQSSDMPAICKPSKYLRVDSVPVLGSGKVDLAGAKSLATKLLS